MEEGDPAPLNICVNAPGSFDPASGGPDCGFMGGGASLKFGALNIFVNSPGSDPAGLGGGAGADGKAGAAAEGCVADWNCWVNSPGG